MVKVGFILKVIKIESFMTNDLGRGIFSMLFEIMNVILDESFMV